MKSRIGYDYSESEGAEFQTFNCALNQTNDEKYSEASLEDVEKAAEIAHAAFFVYKKISGEIRAQFLEEIAYQLDGSRKSLVQQFSKEASLSETRGYAELDRTIFQLQSFASVARTGVWKHPVTNSNLSNGIEINTQNEPIGTVVVFGASNFPFAYSTIGGDSAAALAVGCPVIVKAHPMHAGTSCLVAEIILEAAKKFNLPKGVFSHILSNSYQHGEVLVNHPKVKAVGFTGSIRGGRALMDLAAKRIAPIPVFAEMGSLNPVVFFPEELKQNMNFWIEKYTFSISNDAGQFCTKPGLLFIPSSEVGRTFAENLANQLMQLAPLPQLHPNIHSAFKKQTSELFSRPENLLPYHSQPVLRCVEASDFQKDERLREEFFGPQSIAVFYSSESELLACLELLNGQLTGTIIANEIETYATEMTLELLKQRAGRIIFNGVPTGVNVCEAMVHGGAYPASSDSRFTAVGTRSSQRFVRPIAMQRHNK